VQVACSREFDGDGLRYGLLVQRYGEFGFLQSLKVAHYGVSRHHGGFFESITLGHHPREGKACNDVPASLVWRHNHA